MKRKLSKDDLEVLATLDKHPEGAQYASPEYLVDIGYMDEAGNVFSVEEREDHRRDVEQGWKREKVLQQIEDGVGILDDTALELLMQVCGDVLRQQLVQVREKVLGITKVAAAHRAVGGYYPGYIGNMEQGVVYRVRKGGQVRFKVPLVQVTIATLVRVLAGYGVGLKMEVVTLEECAEWLLGMEDKLREGLDKTVTSEIKPKLGERIDAKKTGRRLMRQRDPGVSEEEWLEENGEEYEAGSDES